MSDPSDLSPESWVMPEGAYLRLPIEGEAWHRDVLERACPTTPAAVQHGSDLDFWRGLAWGVLLGALLWVPILWLLWPKR